MKNKLFTLAEKVVSSSKQKNIKFCVAESCTGGGIAKAITDVPGCSKVFLGGIIAYSNDIKCRLLGVSKKTIEDFGAVSEETAKEMAENAAKIFNADFAIASTGIAGPAGGTKEKPVGTVWIAVTTLQKTITEKNIFSGNRENIREQTIVRALELLIKELN